MAKQKTDLSELTAAPEDIQAAEERTAAAKALEVADAKVAKEVAAIAAESKKADAAAAKEALAAAVKIVAVSHGGNGFLVTETGADGSTNQYLSETDPTTK